MILEHTVAPPKQRKQVYGRKNERGKRTRGAVVEEEEMEEPEEEMDEEDVRYLKPTATFSTIRVWRPDYAVDENEDEYVRGMREWVRAAAEVCALCRSTWTLLIVL